MSRRKFVKSLTTDILSGGIWKFFSSIGVENETFLIISYPAKPRREREREIFLFDKNNLMPVFLAFFITQTSFLGKNSFSHSNFEKKRKKNRFPNVRNMVEIYFPLLRFYWLEKLLESLKDHRIFSWRIITVYFDRLLLRKFHNNK